MKRKAEIKSWKEEPDSNKAEAPVETAYGETKKVPPPSYNKDERWVQEYMEQFGEEPSFF